jgi:hypothetical protein
MRIALLLAVSVLGTFGCATVPWHTDSVYAEGSLYLREPRLAEGAVGFQDKSLFPADQAVMPNEALAQVLNTKIAFPAKARIAVVRMGAQYWGFWTEDLTRLDQTITSDFLKKVEESPRVARAAVVPSIIMPPRITVPLLREAAARTQSDLVLLYQISTRSFSRSRAFRRDETRAYCVVEALLLDVRTGVIPFTSIQTETWSAQRTKEDVDFSETVQKAEVAAAGVALRRVADEVVAYLGKVEER